MKFRKILMFGAAASTASFALVSCQSEDFGNEFAGRSASLSLTVAKDGYADKTRTVLSETEEGNLACRWQPLSERTEQLLVADAASGRKLGVISLKEIDPENPSLATFSGTLEGLADSSVQNLSILYLGTATDAESAEAPLELSNANQAGTMASLTDADLLTGSVSATLSGSTLNAGESVMLDRKMAHAHFSLTGLPAAENGYAVTVSGHNLKNTVKLNGFRGDFESVDGNISVAASADGDIYMTMVPADGVTLTFTTVVDGKSYKGELTARNWEAAEYVREGVNTGVSVNMSEYSDPYAGYENEDPRNPLHKFAKYNLTRQGDATAWENVFANSETENGALYQWGRNYGYMDKSGLYPGSQRSLAGQKNVSGDFTNYFDALGDYQWYDVNGNPTNRETSGGYRVFNFCIYNSSSTVVGTGTGIHGVRDFIGNTDVSHFYASLDYMKEQTTQYLIDFSNRSGDYFVFENGGSNWEERAVRCGYDESNPCPGGWRLPDEKDFREICPASMPSYRGDLSTLITSNAKPELREDRNGVRYVIRWQNFNSYMQIDAIVVGTDFNESDIAAITWDNNNSVVSRKFPFTGNITPYFAVDNDTPTQIQIVFPYTMGTINKSKLSEGSYIDYIFGSSPYFLEWNLFVPNINYGSAVGGYWVRDNNMTFQFYDKSKAGNGSTDSSSISLRTTDRESAYAIRPVMDVK